MIQIMHWQGIRLTLSVSLTLAHKAAPTQPSLFPPAPLQPLALTRAILVSHLLARTACLRADLSNS